MALLLAGLLLLLLSPCSWAAASCLLRSDSRCCELIEIIAHSKLIPHGCEASMRKEHGVDASNLICETLDSYIKNGVFLCERVADEFCDEGDGLPLIILQRLGRTVWPELSVNATIFDQLSGENQSQAKLDCELCSVKDDVPMAVPGTFLLCFAFLCPCFRAKRKDAVGPVSSSEATSSSDRISGTSHQRSPIPSRFSHSPQTKAIGSILLSINQIVKATQNFSPSVKLGEGGFGEVYKAQLPDGQVVAIKRAKKEQFTFIQAEFSNEVEMLTKVEHRNLVKLLGYIDNGNEQIIVTEYVPNGTLREHLDGQHGKILDVSQRLEIAIDIAHALTYLHLYAEKVIIHRDVKSSNILLTDNLKAKVADFGFARSGPTNADQTHISTQVKGTAGYLDPEYLKTYQLTPKSDVYSFGILLVEILSARRPVELKRAPEERITVRWAFKKYNEGNGKDILDPLLDEDVDDGVLKRLLGLAFQCAAPTRSDRPAMREVAEELWEIRKLYGSSVGSVQASSSHQ